MDGIQMFKTTMILRVAALCICCAGMAVAEESGRTIEIHAHRFAFTPSEITVKKGETVKLELFSDDVPHSLQIKDLGIDQTVTKGKPAEVTFTPEKAGDFHGKCGRFCGSGHGQMSISVHVTGD
jgi:cytochrome c oxidase subunit II